MNVIWSKEQARKIMKQLPAGPSPHKTVERLSSLLPTLEYFGPVLGYEALPGEVDISSLGIPSLPIKLEQALEIDFETVLVPMFGWMRTGYRLGRGGGFYDRLLASKDVLAIGIATEYRHVSFMTELHDQRMDIIVTDAGIYNYR